MREPEPVDPIMAGADGSTGDSRPSAGRTDDRAAGSARGQHAAPVFVRAGRVPYDVAWAEQRRLHGARAAGEAPDTVLLLEHSSVYTAGRRTEAWERPIDGTPVIDVDRGGKITWHGPGQLVGYPIVALQQPFDLVAYVRRLEAALITACAELGLPTTRVQGRSGVWVLADDRGPDRKVAAIGIRVSRGVTMHGFALNCDPDLTAFDRIVACGIADAGVTSLTAELGRTVGVADAIDVVESALRRAELAGRAVTPPTPATAIAAR